MSSSLTSHPFVALRPNDKTKDDARQTLLYHSDKCRRNVHAYTHRLHMSGDKRISTVDNTTVDVKTITLPPVSYVTTTEFCTKSTMASNENTYLSNTVSSDPITWTTANVLQFYRAIQHLSWIINGYHAYTYAYDAHFTLNNYETKTYSPTYSILDFAVSF